MNEAPKSPGSVEPPARATSARAPRPYTAPKLVEYGSLGKLTQGFGATRNDFGGMKRMCL